jgi:hypothetical protein
MSNSPIDLAQFDDEFRGETPEDRGDFETVPDGKYQVTVEKVELTQSSTGHPMLKWMLRIQGPTFANRCLWKNNVFTPATLKFAKTDLHVCGLDLEKLSDLQNHLDKLLDVKLEVTKKTKGENTNVYFNRRIERTTGSNDFQREAGNALNRF